MLAPWMRSRARILGSRPDGATSTASLKNTAALKKGNVESAKIAGSSPAITGRPTGTALVAIVPSVSTKGGFHHETQTRIGRGARRRPSRVRGAERGGEAHLHLQ